MAGYFRGELSSKCEEFLAVGSQFDSDHGITFHAARGTLPLFNPWEGTLLLLNLWTHGFFTSAILYSLNQILNTNSNITTGLQDLKLLNLRY